MKLVLTAVAAVALLGSASAFAQTMPPAANDPAAATSSPPAMPGQPAPMTDGAAPMAPPMAPMAPMAPAAPMAPMAPTMTGNTPAGDAPSTYPPCTSKMQDRCVQGAKMTMPAHKMHKLHKAMAPAAMAPADAAVAPK